MTYWEEALALDSLELAELSVGAHRRMDALLSAATGDISRQIGKERLEVNSNLVDVERMECECVGEMAELGLRRGRDAAISGPQQKLVWSC